MRRTGAVLVTAGTTLGHAVNQPDRTEPERTGPVCPNCGEDWLRPTAVAGHYRCMWCLRRYELTSVCPNCGEHSTIVRMSSTAAAICNHCHTSMLRAV